MILWALNLGFAAGATTEVPVTRVPEPAIGGVGSVAHGRILGSDLPAWIREALEQAVVAEAAQAAEARAEASGQPELVEPVAPSLQRLEAALDRALTRARELDDDVRYQAVLGQLGDRAQRLALLQAEQERLRQLLVAMRQDEAEALVVVMMAVASI